MLSNTLVYLIWSEISTILFFYTNVYGGLNVKNKNNLCSAFMLFAYVNFLHYANLCILMLSNTLVYLILTEIPAILFFSVTG